MLSSRRRTLRTRSLIQNMSGFSIKKNKYQFLIPSRRALLSLHTCVFRGRLHTPLASPSLTFLARGRSPWTEQLPGAVATTARDCTRPVARSHIAAHQWPHSCSPGPRNRPPGARWHPPMRHSATSSSASTSLYSSKQQVDATLKAKSTFQMFQRYVASVIYRCCKCCISIL
jgi:hypothetical protein